MRAMPCSNTAAGAPCLGVLACSIPVFVDLSHGPSATCFQATSATPLARMSSAKPGSSMLRRGIIP
jgi:hypothetical protein